MEFALSATIHLGPGVSIDGYLMSDGSFRYGLAYISVLFGYSRNYYRRLLKRHGTKSIPKKLKVLINKGFTGDQIAVRVPHIDKSGSSVAHTVSYDDFCLIAEHEAEIGNTKAFALLTASFRELLRSRTQVAFGLPEDSLEQKQADFQFNYEHYLEDKEDIEDLWLPGDELYYPQYRDWEDIEPWQTKHRHRRVA